MTLGSLGLLLVSLLLGAAGQLLMKMALDAFKATHGDIEGLGMLFQALMSVGVVFGLMCYALSSVMYMRLLADLPVSLLYPMVAMNYVFVTILAAVVLHEHIPVLRVVGLSTIICGVITVALSYQPTVETAPPVEAVLPATVTGAP